MKININIKIPTIDVSTPIGISYSNKLREKVSVIKRKIPPMIALRGTTIVLLAPKSNRVIWGIINPIHPITPAKTTVSELISVAKRMA